MVLTSRVKDYSLATHAKLGHEERVVLFRRIRSNVVDAHFLDEMAQSGKVNLPGDKAQVRGGGNEGAVGGHDSRDVGKGPLGEGRVFELVLWVVIKRVHQRLLLLDQRW